MTNTKRVLKDAMFEQFARIGKALSSPKRLEILYLLSQSSRTVEALAKGTSLSVANTSQHLQRLKQARLVKEVREGVRIRYHLADPSIIRLWLELRSVAERQLAEMERALDAYRIRRHELEKISVDELQARLRNGDVVLIDVRPKEEYHAGHLPGAISIPLWELEPRIGEIPQDKEIVVYCRGPYCVYADEAIELLVAQGWKATRLEEGVVEWQQYGYALEW
jgi:rhodanese-related sulfurtransferase/DNA-binding transcriptional ArsR family regulator